MSHRRVRGVEATWKEWGFENHKGQGSAMWPGVNYFTSLSCRGLSCQGSQRKKLPCLRQGQQVLLPAVSRAPASSSLALKSEPVHAFYFPSLEPQATCQSLSGFCHGLFVIFPLDYEFMEGLVYPRT